MQRVASTAKAGPCALSRGQQRTCATLDNPIHIDALMVVKGVSGGADKPVNGHLDGSSDALFSGHAAGVMVVTGRLVVLETLGSGHSRVSPVTTIRSPRQGGEDLASDVTLQAAEDRPRRQALGAS